MTTETAKERPILFSGPMVRALLAGRKTQTRRVIKPQPSGEFNVLTCPYGMGGDRLWVRETWRPVLGCDERPVPSFFAYRADAEPTTPTTWRPSIFMPRWACRIRLEIVRVRVERLRKISEEDARAEGVVRGPCNCADWKACGCSLSSYRTAYSKLWDELNSSRGFGWDSDPWVWVLEFRRIG